VASREYRNESFSQDRFNRQPIPRFAVAKETQIQCSIQQRGHLLSGDQFSQPQFNPRIQAAIAFDRFGQCGEHNRTAESHCQNTFLAAAQPPCHCHVIVYLREGIPRTLPEVLTNLCQPDTAGCAIEQGIPQYPFKAPDLLAQRRLCHPQLRCRLAEMQGFGDGEKVT